ncbi:MAG: rRNA maturation RNase YbeY [Halothiobacillus sp.]
MSDALGLMTIYRQKASVERCPGHARLVTWADSALKVAPYVSACALTIRFVDLDEAQELNFHYRHKNYATNVLSFPYEAPSGIDAHALKDEPDYLGDLVICQPVVIAEARAQQKTVPAHTAHLVIHGVLHLLGFDHETLADAEAMESREIIALHQLGFANPYLELNE